MTRWLNGQARFILLAFALIALSGSASAFNLSVSLFPRIDFPRVVVAIDAGDRPVDQMVNQVTKPVERALRTVPGVVGVRSTSSRGSAELSVNFAWGADMVAATLQAESAVNAVVPDLPTGTRFEVRRMDPTVFPVLGLALVSPSRDPVALRDFAQLQLAPLLSSVPGVASVNVLGGQEKEYHVLADPARLQALGLSIEDLSRTLSANNVVVATGRLEDRYRLYLVLADNRLTSLEDIRKTVVRTGTTGLVELDDIAEVVTAQTPQWTRVTAQGADAVLLNIRQTPDANSVALVKEVRARLAGFQAETPPDVKIVTYYDQSQLVTAAAGSVRDSILLGAVLAGIVLFVFLRSLRFMLIVALLLPVTLAATTIVLGLMGMSFNMMTLGGMAAAVGLVVDDAVVMLEHLMRRLQERHREGAGGGGGVLEAASEMVRPLVGSTLATVLVFAPLAFLGGVTGGFFKALAVTMSAALGLSLLFALFVAPLLADRWVRARDVEQAEKSGAVLDRLGGRYERLMRGLLKAPGRLALIVGLVMLVIGGFAYTRVGSGFMPKMDEGGFILDYYAAPGTSLAETDRLLREVEAILQATPDVESYSRRTGLQLGGGLSEANEGDFFVRLKAKGRRPIEAVTADVRAQVEATVPGLTISTAQLMEDLIGDLTAVPQPIEVKLLGADEAALKAASPQVVEAIGKIRGVIEVDGGLRVAGDAIVITVDRPAAALEGLDPEAVTRQLDLLTGGAVIGQIQEGEKLVGVRVWTAGDLRDRVRTLEALPLRAPDGHALPLRRIATVSIAPGQPQITRENLQPLVAVTARLEGRDLGSAMREVRSTVTGLGLPSSVRVDYGGLYAEQQKSFRDLAVVFASALLLVGLLFLFLFRSWAAVASILATLILAASSVFLGLWITGTELNISAMMGLTMVIGIVAELGVFYLAELPGGERPSASALITAGRARLRPILMSALIAILALSPLALGLGEGSAMQKPLAIAIITGLIAGVPLILIFCPALLARLSTPARERPQ
ncbi:efflux RND transporter permease subunit [Brevundimonas sp.]|uniref:efflux RND transporter permease subunit n=1 Tax=Brevundimonas sp. TaxID=1871086 RepID=UPI001ACDB961|nr:efflux RND transporter permease subunit [Brevundimonas sp.]MBN9464927.1 efflux RND transporter permease subunit [Brevundimonas sp.]